MARTKIDRRILKTKRSIICALLKLQQKMDVDQISVTALTNAADVNRKTFYLHYKSIEAVSEEFQDLFLSRFRDALSRSTCEETGISASLLFKNFEEIIRRYPDVFQVLFAKNVMAKYLYILQNEIVGGFESLLAPTHTCEPADLQDRIIYAISGTVALYMHSVSKADSANLSKLTDTLTEFATSLFSDCRK